MARSITFKFGADTSQLTKALGGIRKSIGGMLGGFSLGGILGAGIAGFGIQQLLGSMMNLSPKFANTMLEIEERAVRGLGSALYEVQPQLLQLADSLTDLVAAIIRGIAGLTTTYRAAQSGTTAAAGYFTEAAMGVSNRFDTATSWGELFGPSVMQSIAGYLSLPGAGLQIPQPAIDLIGEAARAEAGRSVGGIGASARTQSNPAKSADPRP